MSDLEPVEAITSGIRPAGRASQWCHAGDARESASARLKIGPTDAARIGISRIAGDVSGRLAHFLIAAIDVIQVAVAALARPIKNNQSWR